MEDIRALEEKTQRDLDEVHVLCVRSCPSLNHSLATKARGSSDDYGSFVTASLAIVEGCDVVH